MWWAHVQWGGWWSLWQGRKLCLRTFDRRVVLVHKVTLDELYGQATLAHATASDNHQLVFPKELRQR